MKQARFGLSSKVCKALPVAAFFQPRCLMDEQSAVLPHPGFDPDPCHSLETCQMFTKVFNVYLKQDQPDGETCMDMC